MIKTEKKYMRGDIVGDNKIKWIVKWNKHRMGFSLYPTTKQLYDEMPINVENKLGFKYFDNCGQYKFTERNTDGATYIYINTWNRKIVYRQERENDNMCLEKLYDLIKADLVVKE